LRNNDIGVITLSQFTKKAIRENFLNLLLKKSFDKITVKDIVEACEINRNTFYYYYKDIYDLMGDIFQTETNKVLEEQERGGSCYEEFQRIAAFITSYRGSIIHIYHSKSREVFVGHLNTVSEIILQNYIEQLRIDGEIAPENKKFVCDYYRFSVVGMIINWIKSGMEEDSQIFIRKMSDIFENTVEMALKSFTYKEKGH